MTCHQSLCSRTGIHHGTETAGMNLVKKEVIVGFPLSIAIQSLSRYFIKINKRNTLFGSHLHLPLCMLFTYYLVLLVVGITRCQRHQDGVTSLSSDIVDVFTHIAAIGIYRLLLTSLFDGHIERIIASSRDAGTSTSLIIRSVVIMAD